MIAHIGIYVIPVLAILYPINTQLETLKQIAIKAREEAFSFECKSNVVSNGKVPNVLLDHIEKI